MMLSAKTVRVMSKAPAQAQTIQFALVTRGKNNKPQVKQIELSADANVAVRTRERQAAEEASREALRDSILQREESEDDEDSERSFE